MQTKKKSLLEAIASTLSGFVVAWIITFFIIPAFPSPPSVTDSFQITLVFTFVSIIRTYVWRRAFNYFAYIKPKGDQ